MFWKKTDSTSQIMKFGIFFPHPFSLDMGFDWIAISFVQSPENVIELKEIVGDKALIMAKNILLMFLF